MPGFLSVLKHEDVKGTSFQTLKKTKRLNNYKEGRHKYFVLVLSHQSFFEDGNNGPLVKFNIVLIHI